MMIYCEYRSTDRPELRGTKAIQAMECRPPNTLQEMK